MRIHKKEHVVPYDVDDTLVYAVEETQLRGEILIKDPLGGPPIEMNINRNNVRLLKEEFHRGSHIIVWSRGGYEWAKNVVEALKLTEYVSDVYTKPYVYFDDKDVSEWMNQRVWISPNARYKR